MATKARPTDAGDPVESALASASAAFSWYRSTTGAERAALLTAIAAELNRVVDDLVALCDRETGLGVERLRGEVTQTCVNLTHLADWVRDDRDRPVVHDPADPAFPLGARPDMRRTVVPVGVVLNFAASNFPFAFSVIGVDSAGALAAGCTVVVKAHPGHPETSRATAAAVVRAAGEVFPGRECPLQLVEGGEEGVRALRDPRTAVATFTGSVSGGQSLASVAADRLTPIPFYGELGSINPVVISEGALRDRGPLLARQYVDEVAFSGGQVCVKPGLLFLPRSHGLDETIRDAADEVAEHRLLYPSLGAQYLERRTAVLDAPGARAIAEGRVRTDDDGQVWATPTVVAFSHDDARASAEVVADEVFGPMSVVVECDDVPAALESLSQWVPGSLTATVHLAPSEHAALHESIGSLERLAGRIIVDQWPGAVYTTPAQHHGGPSPATTLDTVAATSVGQLGLTRFQRAVTWQNVPEALLP